MKSELFPRRIVTGDAFCNRVNERKILAKLLSQGTHVWMQAHRRHGKTSLLLQTIEDMKNDSQRIVAQRCHLLFTSGSESIIKQVLLSVSMLTAGIIESANKHNDAAKSQTFLAKVMASFSRLNPKVGIDKGKFSLSFDSNNDVEALQKGLEKLDELASEYKIRAVLIIDEFQELGKSADGILLESVIRDRLEMAKSLTFVFCGSERALMSQAMADTKRPLYNHTYPFDLQRISADSYHQHLNKMANLEWGCELADEVFKPIMALSERHPYYINALCSELWLKPDVPTSDDVLDAWDKTVAIVAREEQSLFQSLTANEKKTLVAIARGHRNKMNSAKVLTSIGLGSSTVTKTLKQLGTKDIIGHNDEGYYVINPCIKAIVKKYS
ncbi:MAG: hypothetical protein ACI8WB_000664 [Phenylobacterium sp.]|jgi:hypothetical protein